MDCPNHCGPLDLLKQEVDIGVGIQEHIVGAECPICREQFFCCNTCGAWSWQDHASWCEDLKSEDPQ